MSNLPIFLSSEGERSRRRAVPVHSGRVVRASVHQVDVAEVGGGEPDNCGDGEVVQQVPGACPQGAY